MAQVLLAFLGATLVITISPGPDTLLVLRNAVAGGRRGAAWSVVGIMLGCLVWMTAVIAGLAALVSSSESLYAALRYLGAAYLAYLGARSLWDWWRTRAQRVPEFEGMSGTALPVEAPTVERSRWDWAREGLLCNLLNAKLGAFLVAFFPQFRVPEVGPVVGNVILAVIFTVVAALWYLVMLAALGRLGPWLARPRVRRGIGGLSGLVLIVAAAFVAFGH